MTSGNSFVFSESVKVQGNKCFKFPFCEKNVYDKSDHKEIPRLLFSGDLRLTELAYDIDYYDDLKHGNKNKDNVDNQENKKAKDPEYSIQCILDLSDESHAKLFSKISLLYTEAFEHTLDYKKFPELTSILDQKYYASIKDLIEEKVISEDHVKKSVRASHKNNWHDPIKYTDDQPILKFVLTDKSVIEEIIFEEGERRQIRVDYKDKQNPIMRGSILSMKFFMPNISFAQTQEKEFSLKFYALNAVIVKRERSPVNRVIVTDKELDFLRRQQKELSKGGNDDKSLPNKSGDTIANGGKNSDHDENRKMGVDTNNNNFEEALLNKKAKQEKELEELEELEER